MNIIINHNLGRYKVLTINGGPKKPSPNWIALFLLFSYLYYDYKKNIKNF